MLRLRNIRTFDKKHIFELGKTLFREKDEIPDLQKALLFCVPELSYVAVEDKQIIGFTLVCKKLTTVFCHFLNTIPNGYELSFFGISPAKQGRGIGSRLIKQTLLSISQLSPLFTCWLSVNTDNLSAIKMYQKLGFRYWTHTTDDIAVVPGYIMGLSHRRYHIPPDIYYTHGLVG
jgi:ribosomal protein S18 acetylase RimI-like enzyme